MILAQLYLIARSFGEYRREVLAMVEAQKDMPRDAMLMYGQQWLETFKDIVGSGIDADIIENEFSSHVGNKKTMLSVSICSIAPFLLDVVFESDKGLSGLNQIR